MSATSSLNSQAVEAAAVIDTLVTGLTPSASFGLLDGVMTQTMALAMQSAVARQQSGGVVAEAALSAACARIVAARPALVPPPAKAPSS